MTIEQLQVQWLENGMDGWNIAYFNEENYVNFFEEKLAKIELRSKSEPKIAYTELIQFISFFNALSKKKPLLTTMRLKYVNKFQAILHSLATGLKTKPSSFSLSLMLRKINRCR